MKESDRVTRFEALTGIAKELRRELMPFDNVSCDHAEASMTLIFANEKRSSTTANKITEQWANEVMPYGYHLKKIEKFREPKKNYVSKIKISIAPDECDEDEWDEFLDFAGMGFSND